MYRTFRFAPLLLIAALLSLALLLALAQESRAQAEPAAALPGQTSLRINELMASNNSTLVDPDEPDETPDWIEIYNPTASPVSLTGLSLTDDPAQPDKHVITASLTIAAHGYLILYADNDPKQGPAHLDFALSAAGEQVILSYSDGAGGYIEIDKIEFPALPSDVSYGRTTDGGPTWAVLRPTPGYRNDSDPPWISQVTTPTVPAPASTFTVSAIITDAVTVMTATLHYSASTTATWVSVPMNVTAGDLYQGQIPALPNGTLVKYYVQAFDDENESTRFPLPGREYGYMVGYVPPVILVSEVVVKNDSIPDPDEIGKFATPETPDWIELYNPGTSAVSLNGLTITNDRSEPLKFRLPNGLSIPPGSILLLLADDDPGQTAGGKFVHLNFTLNASDDYVGLYGGEGTAVVDAFDYDDRPAAGAFARVPDGAPWSEMSRKACMTFNAPNVICDKDLFVPLVRH
ncbi:MAG: lamin tail domain-containing protein [Caldilineaceae bacterium]|nr:lamin tail domain-containing protein [Caldilineaceae bacterium]